VNTPSRPPTRTRIKICGITTPEQAHMAVEAGADAIGLVFVDGSPRCIDLAMTTSILAVLPPFVTTVAVVRNSPPPPGNLTDIVQFHGDEDTPFLATVGSPIIRGFPFSAAALRGWNACDDVDALLVDGPDPGSGRAFDHHELAALMKDVHKPIILAGGLTAETVADAIRCVRPFAVDVSTGVESAPGVKDAAKIAAFCAAVRSADTSS